MAGSLGCRVGVWIDSRLKGVLLQASGNPILVFVVGSLPHHRGIRGSV